MYRLGIDLGGTNIAVGIVDEAQKIVALASVPTHAHNGVEALLNNMARCAKDLITRTGFSPSGFAGAGLGAPGSCDTKHGVLRYAHNLGLDAVQVTQPLAEKLGMPVYLGNDADCAALGEVCAGAAKGCSSALMITLGTGVGSGFIVDGKIHDGFRSLGGEFGHICIAMDGEPCTCGQRGCWEAYASATALIRQAKAAAAADPDSALNKSGQISGRAIYAAAAAGDPTAQAVTAKYAEYVGVGLVNLVNALYPEIILIGGGVSAAGEALLAPVRAYVAAHTYIRDTTLLPEIRIAALGGDAGVIGAAALVPMQE